MAPDWVKSQRESWHGVDYSYHGRPWDVQVRKYCETLRSVDESIGSVLDYLKEAGLDDNTLVIYMGDNGFAWGEHGLIDKRQFYEESVRVPMLVRCPSMFEGGKVIENMVQNVDVAPTIMACAGLEKAEQMVGYSFLPLLKGERWIGEIISSTSIIGNMNFRRHQRCMVSAPIVISISVIMGFGIRMSSMICKMIRMKLRT